MTQQELAAEVGVSRVSIVQFEAGNQHLPLEVIYLIATVLKVGIAVLLPSIEELCLDPVSIFAKIAADPDLSDEARESLTDFFRKQIKLAESR